MKTAARKGTVKVVAIMLATRARAFIIIEAGSLVGTKSVAEVADALMRTRGIRAVLVAASVGEGAFVHILAMSPVRQVEAHAAMARVVAGVVGAVLRAASVVDGAFVHVLACMHVFSERKSVAAAAAIADPADDFTEVVAGSAAAGIRGKGRRCHYRLPAKEDCRECLQNHESHRPSNLRRRPSLPLARTLP